jgi:glyoxylase-like metal-dependent hydrolase (beta-lactamase superfamily II)
LREDAFGQALSAKTAVRFLRYLEYDFVHNLNLSISSVQQDREQLHENMVPMPHARSGPKLLTILCLLRGLLTALVGIALASAQQDQPQVQKSLPNLDEIRQVAKMIPGRRPLRVNVLKFAESRRTKNFSVKGAPAEPSVQARTVYQVVYADGTIMIDSGMDQQVHKFFGRGVEEPFDPDAAKQVEKALLGARSIVMTHEHGDHVAGVIRTLFLDQIAPKTVLTKSQVQTLLTNPQMPEIKLTEKMAERYVVIDYDKYFPFAPGFALLKAAGHTPGSQMIYVVLETGVEYLFVGDSAWHMDNIRFMKGKDASWIKEDEDALMMQLRWLNTLERTETKLIIVVSHDDEQRKLYIDKGVLGGSLE